MLFIAHEYSNNTAVYVKNLGVTCTIDYQLNLNEHVNNYCHIWALHHLQSSLTRDNTNMIASAIVGSRRT